MLPGLQLATFLTMFPEFVNANTANPVLIPNYILLVNNGYGFSRTSESDTSILMPYYYLIAHFTSVSTMPQNGMLAGPSASDRTIGDHSDLVSLTFQAIEKLSLDQSFMTSSRYGQIFWMFTKQSYIQNMYLQGGWW